MKPRLYPLLRRPIIFMLSILSCCLCHFPVFFSRSLRSMMFFPVSVRCRPWSSEMESLSWVCVSLLTADWSNGTEIKTSVNCIKARQTLIIITGKRRWRCPLCLHSHPSCQQHMRKSYAAVFFFPLSCLLVCLCLW